MTKLYRFETYLRPAAEFWENVYIPEDRSACWHWTAGRNDSGHGRFRDVPAHRYSWAAANCMVPHVWLYVCHDCDYPPCVNPAHLTLGTMGDNVRDIAKRDRYRILRLGLDARRSGVCAKCNLVVPFPIPTKHRLIGAGCGCMSRRFRSQAPPDRIWDPSAAPKPLLEMNLRATPAALEFLSSRDLSALFNPKPESENQ